MFINSFYQKMQNKQHYRDLVKKEFAKLEKQELQNRSLTLVNNLIKNPVFNKATTIMVYLPLKDEIQIQPLFKQKKEFYILINAINQENNIIYKTKFFGLRKETINFDSFDATIRQGKHRVSISQIGNAIRRFFELETAKNITAELNNNDIILVDGDLKASVTNEIEYLTELYTKAIEKNIAICAISKTSELFTEKGNALVPVLNEISPQGEWYYFPLVEIENNGHQVDMYIVKLHKSSRYVFKLEIFNKVKYEAEEVFSLLRKNSKDAVFLGYPYGLIEADNLARISNKEIDFLKTIFFTKLGKDNEKISQYLNTLNTHQILDSIGY